MSERPALPEAERNAALLTRLRLIVRKVSGALDLEVTTRVPPEIRATFAAEGKDPDETWFTHQEYDPVIRGKVIRTWVHLPPALLSMPEEVAKGKAAHEAGHVAITRHGLLPDDEETRHPGFGLLLASAEERPTDRVVKERYPGAGLWLAEARSDSLREAEEAWTTASLASPEPDDPRRSVPRFFQLMNLVVYAPYMPRLEGASPDVLAVYRSLEDDLLEMEGMLPPEGSDEEAVQAAARERLRIVRERIWPKARPLLDVDLTTGAARLVAERLTTLRTGTRASTELTGRPDPSAERRRAAEEETAAAERAEREAAAIERELLEIERKQAALADAKEPYERARESVAAEDERLTSRLSELFRPDTRRRTRLAESGSRISLPAVFRWEAERAAGAGRPDQRIFERRELPTERDYAITLLVDLSGSMVADGKIEEAFRAAVLLSEVLARLGVRFEVVGFQDQPMVFKSFDEPLGESARRRMAGMVGEASGTNPGGHNQPAYNDDGPCLLDAARSLSAAEGREKFLLVLSDGIPAGSHSGETELHDAVTRILSEGAVNLVGLGLGAGTEHVRDFYPVSLAGIAVPDLPRQLAELLGAILESPGAFRAGEGPGGRPS